MLQTTANDIHIITNSMYIYILQQLRVKFAFVVTEICFLTEICMRKKCIRTIFIKRLSTNILVYNTKQRILQMLGNNLRKNFSLNKNNHVF